MTPTDIEGLTALTEIGRGGFGVVYRATETDLGRTVAVKVLPPLLDEGAQRRYERERLALGALSGHPNIVTIHRSGRTVDDNPFLVMEYCERGSIGDMVEADGPMAWQEATAIVVKLAGALETAHRAGIVHRDIKPANVLVSNLGEPKLADFGIARMDGAPETKSSSITASLAHAAPEVLDGRRPDGRSDVYSLGSTLYELLVGQPAFVRASDDSMLPILTRIAKEPVPSIPAPTPFAVAEVVSQAMAKRPEDRPASAGEFGRRLAEAQRAGGIAPTSMMIEGDERAALGDGSTAGPDGPALAGADPALDRASGRTRPVGGPFQAPAPAPWPPSSPALAGGASALGASPSIGPPPVGRPIPGAPAAPGEVSTRGGSRAGSGVGVLVAAVGVGAVVLVGLVGWLTVRSGDDSAVTVDTIVVSSQPPELGDDGPAAPTTASTEPPTSGSGAVASPLVADEPLTIGALFPQSGALAFFGPPLTTAAELAVEDINAAGGVLGRDVALEIGDSRDQDPAQVETEVARFADRSVDVIVGPLTASDTRVLLDATAAADVAIISPTVTSQAFTELDTTDRFFRTSPSEVTMGHVTAQILIAEGVDRLALVHIDDPYGVGLSEDIRLRYAQLGGVVVVNTAYDPFGDLTAVVDELSGSGADGIVIIGFNETVDILAALRDAGIGPQRDGTPVFGVDANHLLDGDPAIIDGYRSIIAQVDLDPLGPFTSRLADRGITDLVYTPESYDAVVIAALAAEVSGATSGAELAAAIPGVTRDGDKCFDFAECKRMIGEGVDIDFDGLGGPYELTDDGDPRVASYVVLTYDGGESPNPALQEYVFSR